MNNSTAGIKYFAASIVLLSLVVTLGCGESAQDRLMRAASRSRPKEDAPAATRKKAKPTPTTTKREPPRDYDYKGNAKTAKAKTAPDGTDSKVTSKAPAQPEEPATTVEEAKARSFKNLRVIANALEAFASEKRAYPVQSIRARKFLSWRVELLPFLGYEELYKKFRLNEPWDSNDNLALIKQIPKEYRHPMRKADDPRTNYVFPIGEYTPFLKNNRAVPLVRIDEADGRGNTAILFESKIDDAVFWTKPDDWNLNYDNLLEGMGHAYGEGIVCVMGGGRIATLKSSITHKELKSILTIDGNEPIELSKLMQFSADSDPLATLLDRDGSKAMADLLNSGKKTEIGPEALGGTDAEAETIDTSNALSADLFRFANQALTVSSPRIARQNYYASIIFNNNDQEVLSQYQWVPGLSRPVATLFTGIGVKSGKKTTVNPVKGKIDLLRGKVKGPGLKDLEEFCGELGARLLILLQKNFNDGNFGEFGSLNPVDAKNLRRIPNKKKEEEVVEPLMNRNGIDLIGVWSMGQLIKIGERQMLDCIFVFEIDSKQVGQAKGRRKTTSKKDSTVRSSTILKVIDTETRKTLYSTPSIININVLRDRQDPAKDDPILPIFRDLESEIKSKLFTTKLPSKMLPSHVKKRIETVIIPSKTTNLLKRMAEIRYYKAVGFISSFEMNEYYNQMVSDDSFDFAVMSSKKRLEFLNYHIETLEVEQDNRRKRRRDDDH